MTDFVKYMDDTGFVFKIDITDPNPTIITFSPEEVITKINNNQPLVQKYIDTNFGNGSFANSFDYVTDAQELFYKLQRSRTAISQADELSATLGADIYNNRYTNLI